MLIPVENGDWTLSTHFPQNHSAFVQAFALSVDK